MADTEKKLAKISKLIYPFQKSAEPGKAGAKPTDIDDPQVYFDALSNAQDGFYPIGANGQWHGGIHFDALTGNTLAQKEGIRCIGDGEVVAYRIDSKYPNTPYSAGKAPYSRGFVLVRHRLELPPAPKQAAPSTQAGAATTPAAANPTPATATATPQSTTQPTAKPDPKAEEPSLIFYSVYLHLLDWAGYQAEPKKPRPAFWKSVAYTVGDKAKDSDRVSNPSIPEGGVGLNLRDAQHRKVGYAPRGAKLRLGAESPTKKGYFVISEVVSGQTVPADAKGLYAFKAELTAASAEPDTQDAVYVLPTPAPIKAGELIGYLGEYQRFTDLNPLASTSPAQSGVRPLVQLDVFTAEDLKAFMAKSRERAKLLDAKQKTLLKIDVGAKLVLPTEPDQQIGAEEATALVPGGKEGAWVQVRKGTLQIMDKGSLSGFNSSTHTYGGGQILHRVLGAADSDSITEAAYNALKTKEEKDKYPRRQVLVPSGTPVWVEKSLLGTDAVTTGRSLKAWSKFPLQASQTNGPEAGFIRVAAIKGLKKVATETDGTRWWQVDVGKIDGSSGVGWAREKDHVKVTLCSPWDWPGFEHIEADSTTPEALYARHVIATKQAKPDEQAALEAKAQAATGGPLFSRLCDAIDLDDDRQLSPEELKKALKQPWLAEAISRLVFHHTSEWGTPRPQWDAIDSAIPEPRKVDWKEEKDRIESLQWWKDINTDPALPVDAKVYNLHPIGLITNFASTATGTLICAKCGATINLTEAFLSEVCGKSVKASFIKAMVEASGNMFKKYGVDSCSQIKHLLAQAKKETGGFISFRESLNYSRKTYTAAKLYNMAPTAINNGLARKGITFATKEEKLQWIDENLIANDSAYGEHSFGSNEQPGKDYRGRGLIHLTHYETYKKCAKETGLSVDSNPELLEDDPAVAIETALWFWKDRKIGAIADNPTLSGDAAVTAVTKPVNTGLEGLPDRQQYKREISPIFNRHFNSGCTQND
ncbi:calcium-binding protein [Xanthomonas sp. AmX2]|uniref:glycoside hydrolase family 19 protein n=1 Tax=Xanthomonas sp. TaxID=29446 RepID=UPI00198041FF|nr:glycoside hydrolase family 19 protein [Xanthomonas sp.]MBN6149861.1 calcium-binding protein [Xanthomonas sp.]